MGAIELGFGVFEVGLIAFGLTFWAVLFWGSVRIVDPGNAHNRFGSALAWSVAHLLLMFALAWSQMFGYIVFAAWLVFLLRLLVDFYGVGLLRAILAIIIANGTPYAIAPLFARIVMTSGEAGVLLILFGFPIVTFVVWLAPNAGKGRTAAERPGMPVARLFRRRAKEAPPTRASGSQLAADRSTGPQPTVRAATAPVVAPPVIAPPVIAPPVAPRAAVPPPIPASAPPIAPGASPVTRAEPAPLVAPPVASSAPAEAPRATSDSPSGPVGEPTFLR